MASQEVEKSWERVRTIAKTAADAYFRSDLGPLNFERGQSTFESMIDVCQRLSLVSPNNLPTQLQNELHQRLTSLFRTLNEISNFRVDSSNPSGQRDSIISQLDQALDEVLRLAPSAL